MTVRCAGKLMLGVMLAGLLVLQAGCAREKVFSQALFAPEPDHKALQPAPRPDQDWWMPRHEAILERNRQGNVDLILVGDSITHWWEHHPQLAEQYFGDRTVNLGFAGDQTQHVLWRLEQGEVDGIQPRAAMVMIGTNNSNGDEYTAEQIADGIVAIVRELRTRLPETKILLLDIFPRGEGPSPQREKNARASALASQIADGRMVRYLSINDLFLEPDGTLPKSVMPDLLHPNEQGYVIWGDAVAPELRRMLEE